MSPPSGSPAFSLEFGNQWRELANRKLPLLCSRSHNLGRAPLAPGKEAEPPTHTLLLFLLVFLSTGSWSLHRLVLSVPSATTAAPRVDLRQKRKGAGLQNKRISSKLRGSDKKKRESANGLCETRPRQGTKRQLRSSYLLALCSSVYSASQAPVQVVGLPI